MPKKFGYKSIGIMSHGVDVIPITATEFNKKIIKNLFRNRFYKSLKFEPVSPRRPVLILIGFNYKFINFEKDS